MSVHRLYWVVILGLVALAIGLGRGIADPPPAEPAGTVAVCNLSRAFGEYQRTRELYTRMENRQADIRADQEQREQQFEQMQQELEALQPGSQAYQEQVEAIESYAVESRVSIEIAQNRLKRTHRQATEELLRIIEQTIGAVAAEQGYTTVFNRGQIDLSEDPAKQLASPHLLYAAGAVDITDDVVARLNAQYDAPQADQP
ncbi:MAG: OmpH family outer membrane protein [Planctomycetota bacterium]